MIRSRFESIPGLAPSVRPALGVLLVLPLLLTATGCGLVGQGVSPLTPGSSTLDPTWTGTSTGSSSTGTVSGAGTLPPSITGGGSSLGSPPLAGLPAPEEAKAEIQRVCQRFGLRSIRGSLASSEFVRRLENAYARLPPGSFQNLDVVVEATPTAFLREGVTAWWEPIDAEGRSLLFDQNGEFLPDEAVKTKAVAGRITYSEASTGVWTMVHEVAHHLTCVVDPSFTQRLTETLGYRRTGGRDPIDGYAYQTGTFDKSRVPAESFPTEYAKSESWIGEHLAELISVHLAGNEPDGWIQWVKEYAPTAAVTSVLRGKFGEGVGGGVRAD